MSPATTTRRLSEHEACDAIEALGAVAGKVDPFDFVPSRAVTARVVTLGPFHLRPSEYSALTESAPASTALLANLTPDGGVFRPNVWKISTSDYPFESLKADDAWNGIGSSVLWDADGAWAVVVSNEAHGVVAGTSLFVDTFRRHLPEGGGDLQEILERLYVGDVPSAEADARLLRMVARLYGDAEARRVVADLTNGRT